MAYYRMTAARKAALRKAQLASARKRKKLSRKKKVAIGGAAVVGGVVARHKISGSKISVRTVTKPTAGIGPRRYHSVVPPHGWLFSRSRGEARYNPSQVYKTRFKKTTKGRNFRDFRVDTPKRGPLGDYKVFEYRHNALFGRKIKSMGYVKPVDRDSIPYYNKNAKTGWPHVSAENARKQNAKLRGLKKANRFGRITKKINYGGK
jgi:hypothetical protein